MIQFTAVSIYTGGFRVDVQVIFSGMLKFQIGRNSTMYAGIWKRFFAVVIDELLFSIVYSLWLIILFPQSILEIYRSVMVMSYDVNIIELVFWHILCSMAVYWLYNTLFECSSMQGTLGKALLGIRITDRNGNRLHFLRASTRFISKMFISPVLFGYFVAIFSRKKQALHDIIAGTVVVESVFKKIDNGKVLEAELMKLLNEGHIRTYNDLLRRKAELAGNSNKKVI